MDVSHWPCPQCMYIVNLTHAGPEGPIAVTGTVVRWLRESSRMFDDLSAHSAERSSQIR